MRTVAFVLGVLSASAAFAQIFYQPVQYQYGLGEDRFCYGGSDPRVINYADTACRRYSYGGANLHRFDGGNTFNQPSPLYPRERVFTDCVPLRDASWFGYTCADARNEAYANSPTYFRKADLFNSAYRAADGTVVVPQSPLLIPVAPAPLLIRPYGAATVPATRPGQVIIIPKRLLDRPLKEFQKKPTPLASAQ